MKKTIRLLAIAMVAVMLCLSLASCGGPNANPDKAIEGLKDEDVLARKLSSSEFGIDVPGVDCVVTGVGVIDGEGAFISIIYFEKSSDANDAWDEVKEMFENDKKDEDAKIVIKKSGKMIYCGTKNAIKAAK